MSRFSASAVWSVVKDILLTGTGIWILVSQALSSHPSDPLLVVAMGLCAPAIYDHAKSLVSGPAVPARPPDTSPGGEASGGTSPSSPSAPSSSSSASSSSQEPGERA